LARYVRPVKDLASLLASPPSRERALLEVTPFWPALTEPLEMAADRLRLFVLTWDPLEWLPGREPSPWVTATGDGDWCEVVAYLHWDALGHDGPATLADCAARLLAGVASHEALVVSGGYAQLAAAGAAPPLLDDRGASLPGLRLEVVSDGWDPIGLGAIQDLVQEAYGPVDLDRSTVSLAPVQPRRPSCPACADERFGFPADLVEAAESMCPTHDAAAQEVTQRRLRRADLSNPAGWRAMGKASARLGGRDIPGVPLPQRRAATAGRNDPCPCGSGRKYKRCCGVPA
jgi:hypothetical protein